MGESPFETPDRRRSALYQQGNRCLPSISPTCLAQRSRSRSRGRFLKREEGLKLSEGFARLGSVALSRRLAIAVFQPEQSKASSALARLKVGHARRRLLWPASRSRSRPGLGPEPAEVQSGGGCFHSKTCCSKTAAGFVLEARTGACRPITVRRLSPDGERKSIGRCRQPVARV